jgi:CBS domain-containing membrane protein
MATLANAWFRRWRVGRGHAPDVRHTPPIRLDTLLNAWSRWAEIRDPHRLKCGDMMSAPAIVVPANMPATAARDLLMRTDKGALPVVDAAHRLLGLVTRSRLVSMNMNRTTGLRAVSTMMLVDVRTVDSDEPLASAIRLFAEHGDQWLPVLDRQRRVAGMLTEEDVLTLAEST